MQLVKCVKVTIVRHASHMALEQWVIKDQSCRYEVKMVRELVQARYIILFSKYSRTQRIASADGRKQRNYMGIITMGHLSQLG